NRIKAPIDKAIDWVIGKAVAFSKKIGLDKVVKSVKGGVQKGKDYVAEKVKQGQEKIQGVWGWLTKKRAFSTKAGTPHVLYFKKGKANYLMINSTPQKVEKFLKEKQKELNKNTTLSADKKAEIQNHLNAAATLSAAISQLVYGASEANPVSGQKEKDIETKVVQLMQHIKEVEVTGGTPVVPPAVYKPGFHSGKATYAEARYVFKSGKGEKNHQEGQPASAYSGNLGGALDAISKEGLRNIWVAFHVINDKLGGKATDSNLIPTPRYINGEYNRQFEEPLKRKYRANIPIWMIADINYRASAPNYAEKFTAHGGGMKYENGHWVDDAENEVPPFNASIDEPFSDEIYINRLPTNEADWYLIKHLSPIQSPVLRIARDFGRNAIKDDDHFKQLIKVNYKNTSYRASMMTQVDGAKIKYDP